MMCVDVGVSVGGVGHRSSHRWGGTGGWGGDGTAFACCWAVP